MNPIYYFFYDEPEVTFFIVYDLYHRFAQNSDHMLHKECMKFTNLAQINHIQVYNEYDD